jgi:molecular chaperone GrpE
MAQENKELEELKAKCEEYLAGWKRERADFLNYKKEEMERIGQVVKYANEELILKLLPVLDSFYLSEKHLPENPSAGSGQGFCDGFSQIKKQLEDFLAKEGIGVIETIGKPFDPSTMESVEGIGETVSEEVQRGYTLHGKLIRPAKVKIAK